MQRSLDLLMARALPFALGALGTAPLAVLMSVSSIAETDPSEERVASARASW